MKRALCWTLVGIFTAFVAGCGVHGGGDPLTTVILEEVGRSRAGAILWEIIKWLVLGVVGGIVLAVGGFFLIRALGGYHWQWRHAKWFRVLTLVLLLILCPVLLGITGCMEGIGRGSEIALRESQLGTNLLPEAGKFGADLLFAVHLIAPQLAEGKPIDFGEVESAKLEQFHEGKVMLDVADLAKHLDKISEGGAKQLADKIKALALKEFPSWKGGVGETVLDWLLPALARRLIERKGKETIEKAGLDPFLDNLVNEAKTQTDQKMTRSQVADFFTQQVIVPALLKPVHGYTRGTQKALLIALLLLLVLPVVFFRVAEYLRTRNANH